MISLSGETGSVGQTLLAIGIGFIFALVVLAIHLAWLGNAKSRIDFRNSRLGRLRINAEIILSHLLAAFIFAWALILGQWLGLGGFEHDAPVGFGRIFSFTLINVTTLGLGDILVSDQLRQIAGIQALVGFLMLSCSAQLIWQAMKSEG